MKNRGYPDYYVCLQKINKSELSVVFRRNNLSKTMFEYIPQKGYQYNEIYKNKDYSVTIKILIKSQVFYDLFSSKIKDIGIKGKINNNFGISFKSKPIKLDTIRYSQVKVKSIKDSDVLFFHYELNGSFYKFQLYDSKWHKIDKPNNKKTNHKKYKRAPYESIYNVSSWSVSHPFSGGGFSPR